MTVEELIEELSKLPSNLEVILSCDGEGNNFSPLSGFSEGIYVADSEWSGGFLTEDYFVGEDDAEDQWEETVEQGEPAICLWPNG
jgi:hypothetical protein